MDSIAVLVVRDGLLPLGADEAVAEAGGLALVAGQGTKNAAAELTVAERAWLAELPASTPGTLAGTLAPVLAEIPVLLLPASPDGRDLAPRLAHALNRPLLAEAITVTATGAEVLRWGGRALVTLTVDGPFVATLHPGTRGVATENRVPELIELPSDAGQPAADAVTIEVMAPDPSVADLAEAPRIMAAGAGLGHGTLSGPAAVELLGRVAAVLGASLGATRVVTDAGWTGYQRQIGTTGVLVNPELYIAFGVSGAAQHIGGLGQPRHVVSVNTDPSCPMTALAELGIVADAPATLAELARRLGVRP